MVSHLSRGTQSTPAMSQRDGSALLAQQGLCSSSATCEGCCRRNLSGFTPVTIPFPSRPLAHSLAGSSSMGAKWHLQLLKVFYLKATSGALKCLLRDEHGGLTWGTYTSLPPVMESITRGFLDAMHPQGFLYPIPGRISAGLSPCC